MDPPPGSSPGSVKTAPIPKPWLPGLSKACALANKGCREGYRTFYIRSPKLYYELAVSRGDGSYGKMINNLARTQILIIDDLGLAPMTDSERRDLLEVIEDRHGNASTIISSQLPIEN